MARKYKTGQFHMRINSWDKKRGEFMMVKAWLLQGSNKGLCIHKFAIEGAEWRVSHVKSGLLVYTTSKRKLALSSVVEASLKYPMNWDCVHEELDLDMAALFKEEALRHLRGE